MSASRASASAALELLGIVADEEDPRGLEAQPRQLAREEGAVGVGLVPRTSSLPVRTTTARGIG